MCAPIRIADFLPEVSPAIGAAIAVNAGGPDGSIARVDFYQGATLIGTATAAPYSYTWSDVPLGAYSLTAKATDASGTAATSAAVIVTVKDGIAQVYYIHTDHLDTPRQITDTSGNAVWMWDNVDPFGNNMADENPGGLGSFEFPLRFPGQYFDRETNTHYNINRDYDPAIGAYKQFDPIGLAGGINGYTYVGGNPVSRIDPLGLYWYRQSWQAPSVVGRPDTPVPPRGTVSEFIEQHVSAGYTFGEMHDNFVDAATAAGIPDWLANIPSMILVYKAAYTVEVLRTFGILDQPQPFQCK